MSLNIVIIKIISIIIITNNDSLLDSAVRYAAFYALISIKALYAALIVIIGNIEVKEVIIFCIK